MILLLHVHVVTLILTKIYIAHSVRATHIPNHFQLLIVNESRSSESDQHSHSPKTSQFNSSIEQGHVPSLTVDSAVWQAIAEIRTEM